MNPYTLGTPHHSAWERLATLHYDPLQWNLRDLVDEVLVAVEPHEAARTKLAVEAAIETTVEAFSGELLSITTRIMERIDKASSTPMSIMSWVEFFDLMRNDVEAVIMDASVSQAIMDARA